MTFKIHKKSERAKQVGLLYRWKDFVAQLTRAVLRVCHGPLSSPGNGVRESLRSAIGLSERPALKPYRWNTADIAVVVPVFNAPDAVNRCLKALLTHTPQHVSIVLVDDASTDPAIADILAVASDKPQVSIYRNRNNLGFTRTANRGIAEADERDVVLLNSDTEVTPRWLAYLRAAAYERDDVGTATAVSNSASQFSVPLRFGYPIPYWMDLDSYARCVAQCGRQLAIPIPFGHGFCLYIKRYYIKSVGLLDSEMFPRGYGEEIDYCLKGRRRGWRHVLAPKAFVYHVNGASFGAEKADQKNNARAVLDGRYPEYNSLRRLLVEDPSMQRMRARVAEVWLRGSQAAPRVLLTLSSEAITDLAGLVETLGYGAKDVFVLVASGRQLKWSSYRDRKVVAIAEAAIRAAPQPFDPWGDGYVDVVGRWLLEFAIETVHIHGLRGHSARLGDLCAHLGLPLTVFIDDDYAICPSGSLRDELGNPCGGSCTPTLGDCVETDPFGRRLKHEYIRQWQAALARLLAQSSLVLVDSEIRRARLVDVLPGVRPEHIHVCNPSAPSWSQAQPARSNATSRFTVGVLGIRQRDVIDRHLHNRVLSPLFHPILAQEMSPTVYDGAENLRQSAEDLLIVAYEPSLLRQQAELIVEYVVRSGTTLVLDVAGRELVTAGEASATSPLVLLLEHAADVWFSDEESARQAQSTHRAPCSYIPTCLATDIWQAQRCNSSFSRSDGSRLLFIADSCSVAAIDFVLEVISQVAEGGRHSLEVVAVSRHRGWPSKPWLRHARIPDAAMSYPVFAAWLAQKGPFEIGLVGMDDVTIASVVALEYAALGALPIAASIESTLMPLIAPDTPLVPGARVSDWVDTVTRVIGNRDGPHRHSTQVNEILRQRDIGVAARLIAKRLCRLR